MGKDDIDASVAGPSAVRRQYTAALVAALWEVFPLEITGAGLDTGDRILIVAAAESRHGEALHDKRSR